MTALPAMSIGLNPSTADEVNNDPTVRRCLGFAKHWGYGGLIMTNIFGYRATDPRVMKAAEDPVGPENDVWLKKMGEEAAIVVAAWGVHGVFGRRGAQVLKLIQGLHCFGVTKDGHPRHPLYLRWDCCPEPLNGA